MSGSRPNVNVRIGTEGADKVKRDLEAIGAEGERAGRRIQGATTAASPALQSIAGLSDSAATAVAGLSSRLGVVGSALTGAAAAGAGLGVAITAGLGAAIRGAEQLERLTLRTEAIIKATGGAAGLSAQQIRDLSNEIEDTTLAAGDAVERAAGQLLTFRSVAGDTFGRTLRAAQDLAAAGFGTIESATVQLGKALENPAEGLSALTRVGVSFTAAQKELIETLVATGRAAEAQGVILSAVEQQVGGAGAAEAGGLAGAYHRLGANVDGFREIIGQTGPIQAATMALNALGTAMSGLTSLITPASATQAAEQAVRAAEQALARVQAQNEAQRRASAYGDLPAGAQQAERIAHDNLTEALAALQTLRDDAARTAATRQAQSDAARLQAERETAAAGLRVVRETLDARIKIQEAARQRLQRIDAAERTGGIGADEAARLRAESARREADELAKVEQAHRGVAAATRSVGEAAKDADEHVKAFLKDQEKAATEAAKAQEKAAEEIRRHHERSWDEVANLGVRAFDRVLDAAVQSAVEGGRAWSNFGNVARGALLSLVADAGKLAILNPLLNSVLPLSGGARPTLDAALGGGSGFGDLLGLSSLIPKDGIMSALGISTSGIGASIFGTPGAASFAGGPLAGVIANPGTPGLLGMGGTSLLGGSALTLGGAAMGIGGGFMAGTMINQMLGRSENQQSNGMIGSGLGAAAGFLIGGPLGALLGGAAGGGLGGLFGPGESVRGYGYRLEAADDGLLRMGQSFYNPEGEAAFQQATAGIDALNAWMGQRGITVGGAASVGGNRNGPDYSHATAGSFREGVSQLYYHSSDPTLQNALSARGNQFGDIEELQRFVDGFQAVQATIEALTAEPVPQFTAQMEAITATFDAAIEQAREYGLAEDALAAARAEAIADLQAQRDEYFRQAGVSLEVRRLRAEGRTLEAELAQQAEGARQQLEAAAAELDRWAASAAEKSRLLVDLEEVQAAERAEIIARYGEQAAQALRQAGGNIRAWLDNLASGTAGGASPTDRLAAAQSAFDRDRVLATGGDRDALGRITGSADALLGAGRDMFASGSGFQAIKAGIVGALGSLPVVQSYDAMQTAALEAIQAALENGTLTTAISPSGNLVTIAGGIALAGVERLLAELHASLYTVGDAINRQVFAGTQQAGEVGRVLNEVLVDQTAAAYEIGTALNNSINTAVAQLILVRGDVLTSAANVVSAIAAGAGPTVSAINAGNTIAVDAAAAATTGTALTNTLLGQLRGVAANDNLLAPLVDINTSLGTVDASIRDINASLATVHAAIQQVGTAVMTHTTLLRGNVAIVAADLKAGFAAANTIAVDAAKAATTGTAIGNSHLAAILAATQAGTAHGLVTAGQIQVVANRAHSAVLHIATHQQYTLQGNARLVDINTSLGTVHAAIRDVNASLATVHGAIANGLAASNTIAVDAAAAATTGTALGNTLLADVRLATDRVASSVMSNITLLRGGFAINLADLKTGLTAALDAGNLIAADAANASTLSLAAANTIAVDSNAALVTVLGRIELALAGLRQDMADVKAHLSAGNTIAATGHQIVATTTRDTLAITNDELSRVNTNLRALVA
jgi:hypothetical protein